MITAQETFDGEIIVDNFAGGGGASTGIEIATGRLVALEAIAEEIADVEIMLRQMVILFDCAGQVEPFRRYKLERLAERIKEVKQ